MNITQVKSIISRKFRGATIDDVQGISDYTIFEEGAGNLLSRIDPYETVRTSEINLFNKVHDYSSPVDLKGKKIIDIRPQSDRKSTDDFRQTYTEDFDRDKSFNNNWFSVQFDEATKFLRIDKAVSNSLAVSDTESDNYTAGTGVSNIAEDTILKLDGEKSIRFDVTSGTNLITWAGTAVDLSTHTNKSSFFLEVYYPDSSIITSLTLRIGSDASNYHEITGTIHRGSIRTGVNLYRFDWNGATETGTVDEVNTDYARLALVTTSDDTDIRIGKLHSKLPTPYEIVYYSNALFRPSSGSTWLSKPTANTDIVNLEHEALNLFIYECCLLIADDLSREDDSIKFHQRLGLDIASGRMTGGGLYGDYMTDKPSEAIRPNSRYYTIPRRRGMRPRRR